MRRTALAVFSILLLWSLPGAAQPPTCATNYLGNGDLDESAAAADHDHGVAVVDHLHRLVGGRDLVDGHCGASVSGAATRKIKSKTSSKTILWRNYI